MGAQTIDENDVAAPGLRCQLRRDVRGEHISVRRPNNDDRRERTSDPQANGQGEIPTGIERHCAVGTLPAGRPRIARCHGEIEAEFIDEDQAVAGDANDPPAECKSLLPHLEPVTLGRVERLFFRVTSKPASVRLRVERCTTHPVTSASASAN